MAICGASVARIVRLSTPRSDSGRLVAEHIFYHVKLYRLRRSNPSCLLKHPSQGIEHAVRRGSGVERGQSLITGKVARTKSGQSPHRCFLRHHSREDCSPKYGGCGAKYIYFQRCSASATPFESLLSFEASLARERARGATRKRSKAGSIPLKQDSASATPFESLLSFEASPQGKGRAVRSGQRA